MPYKLAGMAFPIVLGGVVTIQADKRNLKRKMWSLGSMGIRLLKEYISTPSFIK